MGKSLPLRLSPGCPPESKKRRGNEMERGANRAEECRQCGSQRDMEISENKNRTRTPKNSRGHELQTFTGDGEGHAPAVVRQWQRQYGLTQCFAARSPRVEQARKKPVRAGVARQIQYRAGIPACALPLVRWRRLLRRQISSSQWKNKPVGCFAD